jgi:hypothetical protein
MTKLRDKLLPVFDKVARGIPNKLGLRQFDISLRIVSWSGTRPGLGTKTVTDYPVTVNQNTAGNNRPKVKSISSHEIIASGGLYSQDDYRIGPLTPQYVSGGITYGTLPSDVEIAIQAHPAEVFFNMQGPGMTAISGDWFSLIDADFSKNFGYTLVIRKTAQVPV